MIYVCPFFCQKLTFEARGTSTPLSVTEDLEATSYRKKRKKAISTVCQWLCYIWFNQVVNLKFQTLIILSHPPTLSLSHSPTLPLSHSPTLSLSHSLTLPSSHTHSLPHYSLFTIRYSLSTSSFLFDKYTLPPAYAAPSNRKISRPPPIGAPPCCPPPWLPPNP